MVFPKLSGRSCCSRVMFHPGLRPKEEPKVAVRARRPAAPVPAEVTVKDGHVAPMTGPQAHLGKDNETVPARPSTNSTPAGLEIGGAKVKFLNSW